MATCLHVVSLGNLVSVRSVARIKHLVQLVHTCKPGSGAFPPRVSSHQLLVLWHVKNQASWFTKDRIRHVSKTISNDEVGPAQQLLPPGHSRI
jgi:hypothetical protein